MKHYKQTGAIKNLICPLCGGDYCGCADCMGRKRFTFCKSCGIEYQRKAGKALTPAVLKRIKAKLHKAGVWNKVTDRPVRQAAPAPRPTWALKIGKN